MLAEFCISEGITAENIDVDIFVSRIKHFYLSADTWNSFSAESILLTLEDGHQLTQELLQDHEFCTPILVNKKDGLNLKVPPPSFSIQDVENHVGEL